jgi:hemerythrin
MISSQTEYKRERAVNIMLWKDKYELGVPLVDAQHKELFKRVESFMQTLRSSVSWEEKVQQVNDTLEFMKGYVVEHFHDEEEYQQSIDYPGYEAHRQIHADMVKYVLQVSEEYERSGYSEQLMQQFGGKLLAWLINHVAAEDQRIAAYAIEKGVAGNDR